MSGNVSDFSIDSILLIIITYVACRAIKLSSAQLSLSQAHY